MGSRENRRERRKIALAGIGLTGIAFLVYFMLCLPKELFDNPKSTVLLDRDGKLLSAKIAEDGQWRFPANDSVPFKFEKALLLFEDEYFYDHPGVNPVSLIKAFIQNIKSGEIERGGSTLSMQCIRLSRPDKPRSYFEKILEIIRALRAELRYSKKDILSLYVSNAPFGGNVVGLDAAAWRYYGISADKLSWAQTAALAVLPNAPGIIHPGRNRELLKKKRNFLLKKLHDHEYIKGLDYELALEEPLPGKACPIPNKADHLLQRAVLDGQENMIVKSTIDGALQERASQILSEHNRLLIQNEIYNGAIIIVDLHSGEVISYVGNTRDEKNRFSNAVDIISANRSTGSVLKPFLYAGMLQDGLILPKSLIPDIPTQYSGYSPKNFSYAFDGAVPADEALYRSLNIPAVRNLKIYGIEKFYNKLRTIGFESFTKPSSHYGLSLILGGGECNLWDLAGAYTGLARSLRDFNRDKTYYENSYGSLSYTKNNPIERKECLDNIPFNAASIYCTFKTLTQLTRPSSEKAWQEFEGDGRIAWKTGTSFGFRDAWSVGISHDHLVGVWVGNASGEGRPGLTGLHAAAPLMFDVFRNLPADSWYKMPYEDMQQVAVCRESGYRASEICPHKDTIFAPLNAYLVRTCNYHQLIHLNQKDLQVRSDCASVFDMQSVPWFVLPPVQEWYYRKIHPEYKVLPDWDEKCKDIHVRNMELIYPEQISHIVIPRELNGSLGKVVFRLAHRIPEAEVFWHIDQQFLRTSRADHQIEIQAEPGWHVLSIVDDKGETLTRRFRIVE